MKAVNILPLAALTSAFILPSEQVLGELTIEDHHHDTQSWYEEIVDVKDNVITRVQEYWGQASDATEDAWATLAHSSKSVFDEAFDRANTGLDSLTDDLSSWMESDLFDDHDHDDENGPPPPPHHDHDDEDGPPPPPHHGPPPPHHGPPPPHHGRPGHGRRPHHRPHHPPHHKPNETIWQLISSSKYTTKFAKIVSEYDDLVEVLNSTKANYTLFAPTNKAFDNIPEHAHKPTKEQLKAILSYHIVDGFYPAGRVLASHTAPTLLKGKHLSSEPEPQRLNFKLSLRGLLVNFRSRVVAVNIFGTNGVIHGIDTIILPPPKVTDIISFLPGEFSTLELGLAKTGLYEKLNTTKHDGGTFFAPSNFAFKKLGPRINAFLFSSYGEKYLKALLEYHVVPAITLYSDAIYKAKKSDDAELEGGERGLFHIDLPTLLKDRSLSVDIARWHGFITIKINGFSSIALADIPAEDGVIHATRNVLIPPKKLGSEEEYEEEDLTVEEFCDRLEQYVGKTSL